jgi:hypothetical protein
MNTHDSKASNDQQSSLAAMATEAISTIQSGVQEPSAAGLASSRPMRLAKTSAIVNLDSNMTPEEEEKLRNLQSQEPVNKVVRVPRVDADLYQASLPDFQGATKRGAAGPNEPKPVPTKTIRRKPRSGKGINRRRLARDEIVGSTVDTGNDASQQKAAENRDENDESGDDDDDGDSDLDSEDGSTLPPPRGQLVFSFRNAQKAGLNEADLDEFVAFCRELTGESHSWNSTVAGAAAMSLSRKCLTLCLQ